jgi:hypothetical protein
MARERFGLAVPQEAWDRAHTAAALQIRHLALRSRRPDQAAQIGGSRADLLPKTFIDHLSRFHDDVPPGRWRPSFHSSKPSSARRSTRSSPRSTRSRSARHRSRRCTAPACATAATS